MDTELNPSSRDPLSCTRNNRDLGLAENPIVFPPLNPKFNASHSCFRDPYIRLYVLLLAWVVRSLAKKSPKLCGKGYHFMIF